jgi:hypothetical protein
MSLLVSPATVANKLVSAHIVRAITSMMIAALSEEPPTILALSVANLDWVEHSLSKASVKALKVAHPNIMKEYLCKCRSRQNGRC